MRVFLLAFLLHPVSYGWYDWGDGRDNAPPYVRAQIPSYVYTRARCLCREGFWALDVPFTDKMLILWSPSGYGDAWMSTFRREKRPCLNCAD